MAQHYADRSRNLRSALFGRPQGRRPCAADLAISFSRDEWKRCFRPSSAFPTLHLRKASAKICPQGEETPSNRNFGQGKPYLTEANQSAKLLAAHCHQCRSKSRNLEPSVTRLLLSPLIDWTCFSLGRKSPPTRFADVTARYEIRPRLPPPNGKLRDWSLTKGNKQCPPRWMK